MKLISRKCGICLSWYSPAAHDNHCPTCGAYPINHGRKLMHFNRISMRLMASVSAKVIPSVFFHSDSHLQMQTVNHAHKVGITR